MVDKLAGKAVKKLRREKRRENAGKFLVFVHIKNTKRTRVLLDSESRVRVFDTFAEAEAVAKGQSGEVVDADKW
jgi:CRISPR/Cas system-associated exonuclease Cas4 (RecB family)